MTIDEAIKELKNSNYLTNSEELQIAEWLEELKAIKEMDLSIPQHFTKEQSDWIKTYCIKRNIEFYNKAIDDFVANVKDVLITDYSVFNTEDIRIFIDIIEEMAEQLKAGGENVQKK